MLEEDGTAVDKAYWNILEPQKRLIILKEDESWRPPPVAVPSFLNYCKDITGDATDGAPEQASPTHHTIHMFIQLQNNPAALALLNMNNLELIKDFDLHELMNKEDSYGLDVEFCKRIQDMSIELYVKRKTESEAMEFVELLRENHVAHKIG